MTSTENPSNDDRDTRTIVSPDWHDSKAFLVYNNGQSAAQLVSPALRKASTKLTNADRQPSLQ